MPPAAPYRDRFHDTLERLEADVQAQGALVRAEQVWFLVTGELCEFDGAPRVPAPAS